MCGNRRRRCVEADPAPSTRLVTDGSVGLGALALSKAKAVYCRGWGGQCKNGPVMTNRSGKGSCTGGQDTGRKGSTFSCSSTSGLERASAPVSPSLKLPRKTCGKPCAATRRGQFSSKRRSWSLVAQENHGQDCHRCAPPPGRAHLVAVVGWTLERLPGQPKRFRGC